MVQEIGGIGDVPKIVLKMLSKNIVSKVISGSRFGKCKLFSL